MSIADIQEKIDSHYCIFIRQLNVSYEDADSLQVVIDEGGVEAARSPNTKARYKLLFDYIHFSVTSETYAQSDSEEVYTGVHLRRYQKSRYRDSVELMVGVKFESQSVWYGELFHYQLVCGDSIVDVTSVGHPEIKVL